MTASSDTPLRTFEANGIVTRRRFQRTLIVTLVSAVIIIFQLNTGILPTWLMVIVVMTFLFIGLLCAASLMKLVFMRRSQLDVFQDHFVYRNSGSLIIRRKRVESHGWSDLTYIDINVIREAEALELDGAPIAAQASYNLFSRLFRLFVGDPPNYTLRISVIGGQQFTMEELSGDFRYLTQELPALVAPQWASGIETRIANQESTMLGELKLTPEGIQKGKQNIAWQHVAIETQQPGNKISYVVADNSKKSNIISSNILATLPQIPGQVLQNVASALQRSKP